MSVAQWGTGGHNAGLLREKGGGGEENPPQHKNGNPRGRRVIHSPLLLGTPNLAEGAKAAPGTAARRAVAEEARRNFMACCVRGFVFLCGGGEERAGPRMGRRRMRGRLMLLMHAGAATS